MRQLAGLLLGSIPTIILFLLIILAYWVLVYRPLTRVLEERRRRTEGMMEQAHLVVARAEAKAREYEAGLRAVRLAVFHAREEQLKRWDQERETAIAQVAAAARGKVEEAKASLKVEAARAEAMIAANSEELGRRILSMILPENMAGDLTTSGGGR